MFLFIYQIFNNQKLHQQLVLNEFDEELWADMVENVTVRTDGKAEFGEVYTEFGIYPRLPFITN
jgi:hypothetical protein